MQYVQLQITFPTAELAQEMAKKLLQEKLIACAQISGSIQTFYTWKGIEETSWEILLLAKTALPLFSQVEAVIKAVHPYECPQIVALPIITANADYLDWLSEELAATE